MPSLPISDGEAAAAGGASAAATNAPTALRATPPAGLGEVARERRAGGKAAAERERRDIVSGEVMDEPRLIRFVAGPDGAVVPDLAAKLPGRGMWVAADRASLASAVKRQAFSRSAKTRLTADLGLPDLVESLLVRRCLEHLGLAKREGVLISGFEKALASIGSGKAAWMVEASDGGADGRRKLQAAARRSPSPPHLCGAFTAAELGLALGGETVIHVCLLAGRRAGRWTDEVGRLAGFRPLLPPTWAEDRRESQVGGAAS